MSDEGGIGGGRPTGRLAYVSLIGSAIAAAIAVAGVVGYLPGLGYLGSLGESYIPMAPSTSLSILIVSLLILRSRVAMGRSLLDSTFVILGLAESLFTAAKLIGSIVGRDLTPETGLFQGLGKTGAFPTGLMSPATAALLLAAGLGALMLLIDGKRRTATNSRSRDIASILGTLVALIGLTFL